MNENMVRAEYEGLAVSFGEDGWFNATQVAGNFGKRPVDWLAQLEVRNSVLIGQGFDYGPFGQKAHVFATVG